MNIMITPSLLSLFITGMLILLNIYLLINNKISNEKLIIICLISILIGIHGLIHLGVEKEYNYNPLKYLFGEDYFKKC